VIHICKASMREAEAGGSWIQGQLSYIASPWIKKKKKKKKRKSKSKKVSTHEGMALSTIIMIGVSTTILHESQSVDYSHFSNQEIKAHLIIKNYLEPGSIIIWLPLSVHVWISLLSVALWVNRLQKDSVKKEYIERPRKSRMETCVQHVSALDKNLIDNSKTIFIKYGITKHPW
jgi:hypothetical protein